MHPEETAGIANAAAQQALQAVLATSNATNAGSVTQPVQLPVLTVAKLPPAASMQGAMAFVTDATQTAILGLGLAVVGGGANKVPVYSDGTNWLII
jgi:hypothetical protein